MTEPFAHPGIDAAAIDDLRRARLHSALERLLGEVDAAFVAELEAVVRWIPLRSGDVLFRQGELADAAYVVVAGRLRVVVSEGPAERTVADVGRGETVGELALLTGTGRSATVVAIRSCLLARIDRADFDLLLLRRPEAGVPLVRLLGERLRRLTAAPATGPVAGVVVALFPLADDVEVEATARALATALERDGRGHPIDRATAESMGITQLDSRLDDHEDAHPATVYVGDPGWTDWNARLAGRADEVLLVADADGDPGPGELDAQLFANARPGGPRVTLVLRHRPGRQPAGTAAWLGPRPGAAHLHIRVEDPAEIERIARWVTGRSVAVVLGGGGARGWAHVGAARAIHELGVPVDLVGGTSMGALVGAAIADGMLPDEMLRRSDGLADSLLDVTAPVLSLIRGRRIARALERVAREGSTVEDLWRPFFAMATNLTRAEPVVLDRGRLVDAIRASISLPGVLPPVVRGGDLFVDGGVLDNLPVATMRARMGRGQIIAVDVSPGVDLARYDAFEPDVSGWRLLWERVRYRGRRRRVPSILDVVQRTVVAGSVYFRRRDRGSGPDDLTLEPDLGDWGLLEFGARDAIAEAGYQAVRAPIEAWWTARDKVRGEDRPVSDP